jgi:hypothetical protein
MEKYTQKSSFRSKLNKLLRRTQRTEITQLGTNTVTIRNVYKNKHIIEVSSTIFSRCNSRI